MRVSTLGRAFQDFQDALSADTEDHGADGAA